jgi:hypothetical protein
MTKKRPEEGNLLFTEGHGRINRQVELSKAVFGWAQREFGMRVRAADLLGVVSTTVFYAVAIWKRQLSIAGTRGDIAQRQLLVLAQRLYQNTPPEPVKAMTALLAGPPTQAPKEFTRLAGLHSIIEDWAGTAIGTSITPPQLQDLVGTLLLDAIVIWKACVDQASEKSFLLLVTAAFRHATNPAAN